MATELRELDKAADRQGIEALEIAFDTDVIFDLAAGARSLELRARRLKQPLRKRYPMDEVFAPWASWQRGWVAVDGAILAFAPTTAWATRFAEPTRCTTGPTCQARPPCTSRRCCAERERRPTSCTCASKRGQGSGMDVCMSLLPDYAAHFASCP
jgi:hypothetical protein